jgi:serine/threonine-protein kinase
VDFDIGTLTILLTFGVPIIAIITSSRNKRLKMQLEADRLRLTDGVDGQALAQEKAARKQLEERLAKLEAGGGQQPKLLEARVQNLETIVCSVDFELNQRLNRIAAEASRAGLLAAPAPSMAAAQGGGSVGASIGTDATVAAKGFPGMPGIGGALSPGQVLLGRYTIEKELGHGGMGAVYLARDAQLGERVALKVISSALAGDPQAAVERFRREVSASRKVTHPNVIRIHDLGQDGPTLFLSMEYVAGTTLATHLGKAGLLGIDEATSILRQICDGVAAAHAAGVVHRDLKPQNVLLDAERRPKVIDFGLASATFFAGAGMTATGMILGTPEYMAPEQVRGRPCDARTDVYALGGLGYHLFTGRPPFTAETPIAVGFAHVMSAARPVAELRPEVPEPIARALTRALEKEPDKRFADAAELRKALN